MKEQKITVIWESQTSSCQHYAVDIITVTATQSWATIGIVRLVPCLVSPNSLCQRYVIITKTSVSSIWADLWANRPWMIVFFFSLKVSSLCLNFMFCSTWPQGFSISLATRKLSSYLSLPACVALDTTLPLLLKISRTSYVFIFTHLANES